MNLLEKAGTPVGSYAPDFELPGIDNQVHHLSRYLAKFRGLGVIYICNRCPFALLYLDRLKKIQSEFLSQGLTLIGINATEASQPQDTLAEMKTFWQCHHLDFPYLWDSTQDVSRSFGVEKTPTAFLIDQDGVVRYSGQIDDNPQSHLVKHHYLHSAIAQFLNGQVIYPSETVAIGTSLIWRD